MTIFSSTGNAIASGANSTLDFLILWLDFMRGDPGWTISRSSDGTTGGAGDNIVVASDLSQYVDGVSVSWFVLRSPDGLREIELYRRTSDDDRWDARYSSVAGFVDGDEGNRAQAPSEPVTWQGDILFGGDMTAHFTADDAAPYGWAWYCNAAGVAATARGSMGFIPITSGTQPGENDPYVTYFGGNQGWIHGNNNMSTEVFAFLVPNTSGTEGGPSTAHDRIPALILAVRNGGIAMFPNNCPVNDDNEDVSCAIPFGKRSSRANTVGFKGFSSFAQWNGVTRAPLETFAGETRISFGEVNFPWDGATTPTS